MNFPVPWCALASLLLRKLGVRGPMQYHWRTVRAQPSSSHHGIESTSARQPLDAVQLAVSNLSWILVYTAFSFASAESLAFKRHLERSAVTTTSAHGESVSFMCCARPGIGAGETASARVRSCRNIALLILNEKRDFWKLNRRNRSGEANGR
jgi:hypothetical protein